MTTKGLARKLLAELRRRPDATPAEALAAFRRRLGELGLKGKANEHEYTQAERRRARKACQGTRG
jgi:hypothetical protein